MTPADRPADWPLSAHSRRVTAGGIEWHVQDLGSGPAILLIHGTGASTHSFRALAPLLATRHRVVMADCPGVAFTQKPRVSPTLPGMAALHGELMKALDCDPAIVVGHSAGAAIAIEMALDGRIRPERLVSLNGALLPFPGKAGRLFPALAKLLFRNPIAPRFFAFRAHSEPAVDRLLDGTGSRLSAEDKAFYARLFRDHRHVAGTLGMMSHWDLDAFARRLPRLAVPLTLVIGENDKAVPPSVSERVAALVEGAEIVRLPGLGHLAHEEAPRDVAVVIDPEAVRR